MTPLSFVQALLRKMIDLFAGKTRMNLPILRLGAVKDVARFQEHLHSLGLNIPCDSPSLHGPDSPLRQPLSRAGIALTNRIAVHPWKVGMPLADGNISESMLRRWRRLGTSGAKLIWGCEAAAVSHAGRANPNQLMASAHTLKGLQQLRAALVEGHRRDNWIRPGPSDRAAIDALRPLLPS